MTEGKRRDEWSRAAAIQAAVYNAPRSRKDRLISPSQLNPFTAADYKKNRPKISDPFLLAAMCGVKPSE